MGKALRWVRYCALATFIAILLAALGSPASAQMEEMQSLEKRAQELFQAGSYGEALAEAERLAKLAEAFEAAKGKPGPLTVHSQTKCFMACAFRACSRRRRSRQASGRWKSSQTIWSRQRTAPMRSCFSTASTKRARLTLSTRGRSSHRAGSGRKSLPRTSPSSANAAWTHPQTGGDGKGAGRGERQRQSRGVQNGIR